MRIGSPRSADCGAAAHRMKFASEPSGEQPESVSGSPLLVQLSVLIMAVTITQPLFDFQKEGQ